MVWAREEVLLGCVHVMLTGAFTGLDATVATRAGLMAKSPGNRRNQEDLGCGLLVYRQSGGGGKPIKKGTFFFKVTCK